MWSGCFSNVLILYIHLWRAGAEEQMDRSGRRCLQEQLWYRECLAGTPALAATGMALAAGSTVYGALVCWDHDINLFIIDYLSLCQGTLGFEMLCES